MPEEVKDRLHAMARRAKADQGLSFSDGDGNKLDKLYPDDDDDEDYDPDDEDPDDDDDQSRDSSQSSDTSASNTSRDKTDLPNDV